jgi:hypothetical protein
MRWLGELCYWCYLALLLLGVFSLAGSALWFVAKGDLAVASMAGLLAAGLGWITQGMLARYR